MHYELRYKLDDGQPRTAVVEASNVSEAVHGLLELQPDLKGNINRIKSCYRVVEPAV